MSEKPRSVGKGNGVKKVVEDVIAFGEKTDKQLRETQKLLEEIRQTQSEFHRSFIRALSEKTK